MRAGIIQPNFIPWRGYFDFIRSVDIFILLDDVQYTRRDWRSRNRIKTPRGPQWLSVPVQDQGRDTLIRDARIDHSHDWRRKHLGAWQANYGEAPHFHALRPLLDEMYATADHTLLQLNARMIAAICRVLGITTPIVCSSRFAVTGARTRKLIGLLNAVGASRYLSGSSADVYLDKTAFIDHGIALEYKSYDYRPYPQRWGPFEGEVTVLDMIAHCGTSALACLHSHTPDRVVIEPACAQALA